MTEVNNGSGFTTKEILLEMRGDLRTLTEKIDRIDRQGSIGTKAQLDDHENRLRKNTTRLDVLEADYERRIEDSKVDFKRFEDLIHLVEDLRLWRAKIIGINIATITLITAGVNIGL